MATIPCVNVSRVQRQGADTEKSELMDDRLTELEIRLSMMEDMVDELNRTVFRQQERIDLLQEQLR